MLLSAEVLRNHTQNINITIITVCPKSKTPEDFHSETNLFKINNFIHSWLSNFLHPAVYYFSELFYYFCFEFSKLMCIIIKLRENILYNVSIFFILLRISPLTDNLMRILKFLEILIRRQIVGLLFAIVHDYIWINNRRLSSFFKWTKESSSSFDPVWLIMIWPTNNRNNIIRWMACCWKNSSSFLCLVHWTLIMGIVYFMLCCLNRLKVYHWNFSIQYIWQRLLYISTLEVNTTGLWVKSIN